MDSSNETRKDSQSKREMEVKHIPQTFDSKQDHQVGSEYFERLVDVSQNQTPRTAVTSTYAHDATIPSDVGILQLQKDFVPTLSREIAIMIEKTIQRLMVDSCMKSRHCQTCMCLTHSEMSETEYLGETSTASEHFNRAKVAEVKGKGPLEHIESRADIKKFINISQPEYYSSVQIPKQRKYVSDRERRRSQVDDENSKAKKPRPKSVPIVTWEHLTPWLQEEEIKIFRNDKMKCQTETTLTDYDKRECMAQALQWHIHDLVDGIIVNDSELPDSLITEGCLTEEECSSVREGRTSKDQVRVLIRLIKGRDLTVLQKFLQLIRSHNEDIAKKVQAKYDQNIIDGVRYSKCALCQLTHQVNVQYLADTLWRNNVIEEGLYNMIIDTSNPTGAQGELWNLVIQSLNGHRSSNGYRVLTETLTAKGHYCHIAKGVEKARQRNNGELSCRCECRMTANRPKSIKSSESSKSPQSSEVDLMANSQSGDSRITKDAENTNHHRSTLNLSNKSEMQYVEPLTLSTLEDNVVDYIGSVKPSKGSQTEEYDAPQTMPIRNVLLRTKNFEKLESTNV